MFAAIFDMDGVLINSTKIIWEANNEQMAKYGVSFDSKDIKEYLGLSLRDQIAIWNKKFNLNLNWEEYAKESRETQLKKMSNNPSVPENLVPLLESLKKHNVPLGIGTASSKIRAHKMIELAGLSRFFPVLIGAEDCQKHKPNPELFLEVARRLNVDPRECVVFEDAANGIKAAKNGNMKAIGYLTDYATKEELHEADLIISNFSEISYEKLEKMFKE